jgi:pimeloyl-ACP methyl ester carboxylesterase
MISLLDAKGLDGVNLVAWSIGTFVVQQLELEFPEWIDSHAVGGIGPGELSHQPVEDHD